MTDRISDTVSVAAGLKVVQAGFNAIASSMGGAVSRFDTLQQFPKMMEQLGHSTEDASSATKKLSEGIDGLPTSLDDVAATAQRLTTLTGNLEKSTDTTIALNNAFLASGASSDQASRGLDQYVKMLSTGKVNLMSWTTLQQTMGYALQETAVSFGYAGESAQNDLYEALQSGKVTFDDFNSRLVELNEGVGGFAEVAKTASTGIATSFTNIKTAVVKNLANMITKINESMAVLGFPGIAESLNSTKDVVNSVMGGMTNSIGIFIDNAGSELQELYKAFQSGDWQAIGKGFVDVIDSFITTINNSLPDIVQSAAEVINSFLQGLSANPDSVLQGGILIYTTILDGIRQIIPNLFPLVGEIVSTFIQGFIEKLSLVSDIGIQLITSIITGIADNIDLIISKAREAIDSFTNTIIENLPDILQAGIDIIFSLISGISETLPSLIPKAVEMVGIIAQTIIENIPLIIDAASQILDGIAEGLADVFPIFQPISDAIKFLSENLEILTPIILAVTTAFAAYKAVVAISALIDGVAKATKGLTVAQIAAELAQKALNLAMSLNPIGIVIAAISALVTGIIYLWNTNDEFREALTSAWETIKDTAENVFDAIATFFTETIPNAIQSMLVWFQNLPENIKNAIDGAIDAVAEWGSNMLTTATEWIGNTINGIISFFNELPGKIGYAIGYTTATIIKWGANLISTIRTEVPKIIVSIVTFFGELPGKIWIWLLETIAKIIIWRDEMIENASEAARSFIDNVISTISELPGKIWNWLLETIAKIIIWRDEMIENGREAASNFASTVITTVKNLPQKIWNAIIGAKDKVIKWGKDLVTTAGTEIGNFKDEVIRIVEEIPGKMFSIGENIIKGLWDGVNNVKEWFMGKFNSFIGGITKGAEEVLDEHSPSKVFAKIGKYLVQGFWNGIDGEQNSLYNKVNNFMGGVIDQTNNIFGIASPSKVFAKIGKYLMDGLVQGMGDNSDKVKDILKDIVDISTKTLKDQYNDLLREIQTAESNNTNKLSSLKSDYKKYLGDIKNEYKKTIESIEQEQAKLAESISGFAGLFQEPTVKEATSPYNIMEYARTETEQLDEFYDTLEELKKRNLPQDLINQLADMGPESVEQLKSFNQLSDEEIKEYLELQEKRNKQAAKISKDRYLQQKTDAKTERDKLLKEAETDYDAAVKKQNTKYENAMKKLTTKSEKYMIKVGEAIKAGLTEGTKMSTGEINTITDNLVNDITKKVKKALKISSPSKVYAEIGKFTGQGYVAGLKSMASKIQNVADDLFSSNLPDVSLSTNISRNMGTIGTSDIESISTGISRGSIFNFNQNIQANEMTPREVALQAELMLDRARWVTA